MARPARILHCHSTFTLGGKEARAVRLMNAFGDAAEHVVLSAMSGALAARESIDPAIRVAFPADAPPLHGKPGLHRYADLAAYMAGFDLVLSYNWGAMDVVGARRLFAPSRRLPPLIHHEDGFNEDEAERQKPARVWYRRLMLPAAAKLVVPSQRLERIARGIWRQPAVRIERIPNGIRLPDEAEIAAPLPIPGVAPGGGLVIGTVAGLRPVKNLRRLVRIFAKGAPGDARLVILGEGPDRGAILAEAAQAGVADRVILPGFVRDPVRCMAGFDIFALSSDSEQFPISLVEAMACGLPGLMTDVGDIAAMAAPENRPFILPPSDEAGLAAGLARLAADPALRRSVGAANRGVALQEFAEQAMINRYHKLYWDVMRTI
ncbi:glycosyl transferase family 1 [Sphingomonas sp. Root710]|uniref:glycosyltransferase n=1 Tax=Sphingomonas sp. Root710 TaxID=1736594 RepID=UPI0006F5C219|nr:glycosyltransferase [Sphingomonas sp. Root710]KRB86638.1 glycosyl transferase family 1 [Sphingomonas sp. Root710]